MEEEIIDIEGIKFSIIHYDDSGLQQLNEARSKGRSLTGTYSYDLYQPHNSTGEYHLHLYDKGNQILAINKGGSAHDGYHGVRIPNKAFKALQATFPDWAWPNNQILESQQYTFILDSTKQLRPVSVFRHRNYELHQVEHFIGFFHQFADDPFLAGQQGYVARTVALIEGENGNIQKVPVDSFRFLDL